MPRRIRRPLGLRAGVTVSFTAGALGLSMLFAAGTYLVARQYLVTQREQAAIGQAFAHASFVRDGLLTSGASVSDVLGVVSPAAGSVVLVRRGDRWFSSALSVSSDAVPTQLRSSVGDGDVALAWTRGPRGRSVAVGVPLPAVGTEFYEITYPSELQRTLSTLRGVLAAAAVITTLLGALLGRWAARSVVAPLDQVAGAAARIAGGDLDARLHATDDPDLATIVGSFNSMVDALHERIQRESRFVADVSHELRSPLTALVASAEVVQRRRDELSPRAAQALDLMTGELGRFERSLDDLLELGRLDAGVGTGPRSVVDVRDLVRGALEASGRPVRLLAQDGTPEPPGAGSPRVEVDKQQLKRALINLFENADRHGEGLRRVSVGREGEDVLVVVDDAGPGVPADDRYRVFERFARGGSRASLPGTGLGLSLVAETARAHDGDVWCTDSNQGGARFVLRLPTADDDYAVTS